MPIAVYVLGLGIFTQGTVAIVASGLTLATIVGVPAGTVPSQFAGWRAAFWGVAVLTLISAVAALIATPGGRESTEAPRTVRSELRAMARPQLWLSYSITAFGFGAVIVTFSYLASLLTEESKLPAPSRFAPSTWDLAAWSSPPSCSRSSPGTRPSPSSWSSPGTRPSPSSWSSSSA